MRTLRPNSRGVIVPVKPVIRTGGQIHPYYRPSVLLKRIDKIRAGDKPKICITRKQGGLGDVMMTLPTVKAISNKYQVKVDYGTDFDYLHGALHKVLEGNPYINKVISWRELDSDLYDGVIDLTCPCVFHEVPNAKPINRIDLFARYAGIKLDNCEIDYYMTEEEVSWAEDYVRHNDLNRFKLILVQPSSSSARRDAPLDKMKHSLSTVLAARKDVKAIVITHGTDNVKSEWNYSGVHVFHDFDCRKIAAIMTQCDLVICPDSAILHIASALHHKTLTLFGPTDPYARVNYHPEAVAIWPGKELANYPAWFSDPGDGYLCWKRLEVDLMTKATLAMLDNTLLPQSNDFVTFGKYEMENQYYEII